MAGRAGPDTSPEERAEDAAPTLVLPPPIEPGADAAPALTPPDLCRQLRSMFFARTFQEFGSHLPHAEVLRLGAAVYGHEFWRRVTYEENRQRGYEGLDLNIFRDAFDDLDVAAPEGPHEYPAELGLVAAVLRFRPEMLVMNPLYIPTAADIAWARTDIYGPSAWGIAVNLHHVPSDENIAFARVNPRSNFSAGIFENPNFVPTEADIDYARLPASQVSSECSVVANPNFTPTPEDVAIARADLYTAFASYLTTNPNFVPTAGDVTLAREYRNSFWTTRVMQRAIVVPTGDDVAFAMANPNLPFSQGIALNPNYTPTSAHIEWALANPRTPFASSVAVNPNYVPTEDHINRADPETGFAWGLVENRTVFLRLTRSHAAA
jgi:hypothetical protein